MVHRTLVRVAGTAFAALFIASCSDYGPSDPGPRFEVDPVWATLEEGDVQQLTVRLNGEPADATWETTNSAVATVSPAGLVTAVAPGFAAITATSTGDPSLRHSSSITVPTLVGTALTSGTSVTLSGGPRGEFKIFRIRVPEGSSGVSMRLVGGTGDADMYVRHGVVPQTKAFGGGTATTGCRRENAGTDEACSFTNPAKGQWYIRVETWDPYEGAVLTATVTP